MTREAAIIGGGVIEADATCAAAIVENMGARVITPAEVRAKLKLDKRAPVAK